MDVVAENDEVENRVKEIDGLEEMLMEKSNFGDNLSPDLKELAGRIVGLWDQYMDLPSADIARKYHYAAPHVYALGSWIEDKINYGILWAYLTNKINQNLSQDKIEEVQTYREKFRSTA